MEDRLSPGLYLEMADEPAPAEGVSVWENVRPGRDELPRELPEFRYLHIREVGDDFVPAGDGLHFRRYPRPAQGRLTGNATLGLLLVLISPTTPGGAQALRDWADFVHISPSAENRQPWVFVVVRDANTRAAIGDLTRRAWRGGARQHSEGRLEPRLLADVEAGAEGGVSDAPVLVVVGGDAATAVEAALPS